MIFLLGMNGTSIVSSFLRIGALTAFFIFCNLIQSQATHLRAGEITVERVDCSANTFLITITVYTNTVNTTVLFGGDQDILYFGDGEFIFVPQQDNIIRYDLEPSWSVATATYSITHTYDGGRYVVSYREPNRNEGVLNMDASVNTTFYLETVIDIDPFLGCNNTPILQIPPIDHACPGVAWSHNPGAVDSDGDSLSYSIEVPFSNRNTQVVNYADPNHPKFYTNYNTAKEDGGGPPTFFIEQDGTLHWDSPGAVGEYNIAFHVIEWRKISGQYYPMGYVRRDMQILVDDCDNERPDLILPPDTCVVAGTVLDATILGIDPDNDDVKIEAFSDIFSPSFPSHATYSPVPGVNDFQPSDPAELKFHWQTECAHVKDQPYQVVFKITDNPPNGPKLATFKTWLITVVGPAPEWEDAQLSLPDRSATLEWEPYACERAERMQVWRKVDGSPFVPANCQTGMPDYLGYELLSEVNIKQSENNPPVTSYVDTNSGEGLAPGAQYCYRLVAVFPLPSGGESYVSRDTCIAPIPADVPIITHVSVEKTDASAGEIRGRWEKPFDANATEFPPPYPYELYRAIGFSRGADSVLVASTTDTTFLNGDLNTLLMMIRWVPRSLLLR